MAGSRQQYMLEVLIGGRKDGSFDSNLRSAQSSLDNFGSAAKKIAGVATAAFAAINVKDTIVDAVDEFASFEQAMANTAGIMGATELEYSKLEKAAREAGASTTKTAQESAEALGYMALAGWDVEQSTSALEPVLKLSAASGMDLARTSDLVTDSMSALGLSIEDLPHYLDMVAKGQNSSNQTAEQMMEAYIQAGGAAKTLGLNARDTGTALGILANNGKKGAEGGRAVNSILNRIGGNTTAIKQMKELGISIFDAQGKFVGFEQVLKNINAGLDGLTQEQRTKALVNISGLEYNSQMQNLLSSVREGANGSASAWDDLNAKIQQSGGSLETMYGRMTDTMSASKDMLNSAISDAKISFADAFDGEIVDIIHGLTDNVNGLSEDISNFANENELEIHEAFTEIEDMVSSAAGVIGEAGAFIVDNFDTIISGVEGLGAAVGAYKAANGIKNIATSLIGLGSNPVGLGIAAVGAAGAAMVGLTRYAQRIDQAMVDANLAEHFGNIRLSLEDIDDISQQIVGKKKLVQVSEMLESIGKTDDAIKEMTSNFSDIERISWKIKAGFEIDADDTDLYVDSVRNYVKAAQDAVDNEAYSVSIATKLLFGRNSEMEAEDNAFYSGLDNQLKSLEKQLNDRINEAVEKGVDIDTDKAIQELLGQIDEITSAVTDAEDEAKFESLKLKYSGVDMDAESFKQLTKDIGKYNEENLDGLQKAYEKKLSNITAKRNMGVKNGGISQKEYKSQKAELEQAYYKKQGDATAKGIEYITQKITEKYPEFEQAQNKLRAEFEKMFKGEISVEDFGRQLNDAMEAAMGDDYYQAAYSIQKEFGEQIQSSIQEMHEQAEQMKKMGVEPSKEFAAALASAESLANITDSSKMMVDTLEEGVVNNPEWAAIITAVGEKNAGQIPPEIAKVIREKIPIAEEAARELIQRIENSLSQRMSPTVTVEMAIEAVTHARGGGKIYDEPIGPVQQPGKKSTKKKVHRNAKGGIYDSPILTTFAERGAEAAIPLDGSPRAKSLLMHAGNILGMDVIEDNTNYRKSKTAGYYQEVKQSLSDSGFFQKSKSGLKGNSSGDGVMNISFAPKIEIKGNASKEDVSKALKMSQTEFASMMNQYVKNNGRVSFAKK